MCFECKNTKCIPRCPNFCEEVFLNCEICGGEIYYGEYYYEIYNEKWCADCVKEVRKTAG